MNKHRVMFNFDTGKYDVINSDSDEIISSWDTHNEAIAERNYLITGIMDIIPTED